MNVTLVWSIAHQLIQNVLTAVLSCCCWCCRRCILFDGAWPPGTVHLDLVWRFRLPRGASSTAVLSGRRDAHLDGRFMRRWRRGHLVTWNHSSSVHLNPSITSTYHNNTEPGEMALITEEEEMRSSYSSFITSSHRRRVSGARGLSPPPKKKKKLLTVFCVLTVITLLVMS